MTDVFHDEEQANLEAEGNGAEAEAMAEEQISRDKQIDTLREIQRIKFNRLYDSISRYSRQDWRSEIIELLIYEQNIFEANRQLPSDK